jgi:thioredoxin-related protein
MVQKISLFILLALLFTCSTINADEAYVKAKEYCAIHQTKIFIFFGSTNCGPCKNMKNNIIPRTKGIKRFYRLYYNIDKENHRKIALKVWGKTKREMRIPFFMIVAIDKNKIATVKKTHVGGMTQQEFEKWIVTDKQ